jgi:hypothetical protein
MLCALTVRRLKPGTLEEFKKAFVPTEETEVPAGWRRFYAIQNVDDPNEVITFGLFDGTLEELRGGQRDSDYDERRSAADEFVDSVGTDGIFEVLEERSLD